MQQVNEGNEYLFRRNRVENIDLSLKRQRKLVGASSSSWSGSNFGAGHIQTMGADALNAIEGGIHVGNNPAVVKRVGMGRRVVADLRVRVMGVRMRIVYGLFSATTSSRYVVVFFIFQVVRGVVVPGLSSLLLMMRMVLLVLHVVHDLCCVSVQRKHSRFISPPSVFSQLLTNSNNNNNK